MSKELLNQKIENIKKMQNSLANVFIDEEWYCVDTEEVKINFLRRITDTYNSLTLMREDLKKQLATNL